MDGSTKHTSSTARRAQEGGATNRVYLRGRLAADPLERILPSGDRLCAFRLTVPRPDGERVRVDSLDCAVIGSRARQTVQRARPSDELEITGRLHRRFWRSAAGLGSRYEVAVLTARLSARSRPARRRSDA